MGVAASPLLPALASRRSALQERVQLAVPLARGLQHAARGAVEPAAADGALAEAGVQDGLWTGSAAPAARPHSFWKRTGQEDTAAADQSRGGGGGDHRLLRLQTTSEGVETHFEMVLWSHDWTVREPSSRLLLVMVFIFMGTRQSSFMKDIFKVVPVVFE